MDRIFCESCEAYAEAYAGQGAQSKERGHFHR
jgi:hypothetical protein